MLLNIKKPVDYAFSQISVVTVYRWSKKLKIKWSSYESTALSHSNYVKLSCTEVLSPLFYVEAFYPTPCPNVHCSSFLVLWCLHTMHLVFQLSTNTFSAWSGTQNTKAWRQSTGVSWKSPCPCWLELRRSSACLPPSSNSILPPTSNSFMVFFLLGLTILPQSLKRSVWAHWAHQDHLGLTSRLKTPNLIMSYVFPER